MARPTVILTEAARRELESVLCDRVASLSDQRRQARARGDTAAVQPITEDLSALRRAGTLLGCPVPANTGYRHASPAIRLGHSSRLPRSGRLLAVFGADTDRLAPVRIE